jgi:hypothetical protein
VYESLLPVIESGLPELRDPPRGTRLSLPWSSVSAERSGDECWDRDRRFEVESEMASTLLPEVGADERLLTAMTVRTRWTCRERASRGVVASSGLAYIFTFSRA